MNATEASKDRMQGVRVSLRQRDGRVLEPRVFQQLRSGGPGLVVELEGELEEVVCLG